MKIIVIKSRYLTTKTSVDIFEGTVDEFKKYITNTFSTWFNGSIEGCNWVVDKVLNHNSPNMLYVGEIAAWFKIVEKK